MMKVAAWLQNESGGGMERLIDQDKVAAAQTLLDRTRAHADRCGPGAPGSMARHAAGILGA